MSKIPRAVCGAGMKRSNAGMLGYWNSGITDNSGIKRLYWNIEDPACSLRGWDGKRMNRMSLSAGMASHFTRKER